MSFFTVTVHARRKLLDSGLWAPHAQNGACLPYYNSPALTSNPTTTAAAAEFDTLSSSVEVQKLLEYAGPGDLSGLARSYAPDEAEARAAACAAPQNTAVALGKSTFNFGSLGALGRVVLNPSDPTLTFEALPAAPEAAQDRLTASGVQLLPPLKPIEAPKGACNLAAADDPVVQEFLHFNISNDAGIDPLCTLRSHSETLFCGPVCAISFLQAASKLEVSESLLTCLM